MTFDGYATGDFYDELFFEDGTPRPEARPLVERIKGLADGELVRSHHAAARALLRMGITFNVYDDGHGTERIFPSTSFPASSPGTPGSISSAACNSASPP